MAESDAYQAFNQNVAAWATATKQKLRGAVPSDTGALANSFVAKKYANEFSLATEAVVFSFARHAIFVDLGVGRGRGVGSNSAAKAAQPFFENTLAPKMAELANIIDKHYADDTAKIVTRGLVSTFNFLAK